MWCLIPPRPGRHRHTNYCARSSRRKNHSACTPNQLASCASLSEVIPWVCAMGVRQELDPGPCCVPEPRHRHCHRALKSYSGAPSEAKLRSQCLQHLTLSRPKSRFSVGPRMLVRLSGLLPDRPCSPDEFAHGRNRCSIKAFSQFCSQPRSSPLKQPQASNQVASARPERAERFDLTERSIGLEPPDQPCPSELWTVGTQDRYQKPFGCLGARFVIRTCQHRENFSRTPNVL